jgi:iron(III) transport system permease protein
MTPAGDAMVRRVAGLRRLPRLRLPASPGVVLAAGAVALVVAVPLIALIVIASRSSGEVWPHLVGTVLPRSTRITLTLMLAVGLATAIVGVGTAWLVAMCRFPGRAWLEGALVLPLAVPTYIVAYCYAEMLGYTGPVQGALRAVFGFETARDYWFPEIRSLPGIVFVLTAVLYPYVYMTTRLLFLMQSSAALDVARTLGAGPFRMFFRVALPLARPAVAVGVSLALMETLNDIGAVEFFGVRTLSFAVYDIWLNRGSLPGAAQLALVLLLVVFSLILAERLARGRQRYHVNSRAQQPLAPFYLKGWKAVGATLACLLPVLFGFALPAALLVDYSSRRLDQFLAPQLLSAAMNSLSVAAATAVLAVVAGLVLAYAARLSASRLVWALGRFASIGYAVPGTVLAVGILIPLAALDNYVDGAARSLFGVSTGLLLAGSGAAIVYACTVRFLAVSTGSLEAGLAKVSLHLDMAARTLRRTPGQTLREIHLPLMRRALATAALLVFVDTMKELSATILLRPFDFDTLATFVYSQASRAAFEDASVAALAIVVVGIVPLILLLRAGDGRRVAGIRA